MLELIKPKEGEFRPKSQMLVVFNLNWKSYDIHERVNQASRRLDAICRAMGANNCVRFDLASLGAGELIFSKGAERIVPTETLDFLRHQHAEERGNLEKMSTFRLFKNTAETLKKLCGQGHKLAVAFEGSTEDCDKALKDAHLRDFFETSVYGSDVTNGFGTKLYTHAMQQNGAAPHETLMVEEFPDCARASRRTGASVAGYISLENCPEEEFHARQIEMKRAGVTHFVTTPHDIANLPDRMAMRENIYSKLFPELN